MSADNVTPRRRTPRDAAAQTRKRTPSSQARARRNVTNNQNIGFPDSIISWLSDFVAAYRKQLSIVGAVLALVIVIGVFDSAVNAGKIYTGVHVGAVDVSGMTVEEATTSINGYYSARILASDVHIYGDESTMEKARAGQTFEDLTESEDVSADEAAKGRRVWTINAAELQADVAAADLASQALKVGREDGGIFARVSAQTFGWNVEPTLKMSDSAIESLAKSIDRAIGEEHEDYDVVVEDGSAYVTTGHAGREVNRDTLRAQITSQLMDEEVEDGFVATVEDAPVRIDEDAAQALADHINAGIAHGATFQFEGATWEASAYDLGNLIVTKAKKDAESGVWNLVASYDESKAKSAILANLNSTYNKQNVKVEFTKTGDTIMVNTNATGVMPVASKALSELAAQTLENTPASTPVIIVEGTEIPASMTIDAAMDYGLITTISSFETEYTEGATNRNTNIHLAADLINNSIAKANGGTWSFNAVAGECNAEKGFKNAGAIVGGEIVDDIGGGICQVATTVFNAVYEAGLPIEERSNHSIYIASYPNGRDAAIDWPELDLIWRNDTNCDILLQTSYTDSTITVTLLGVDPGYKVQSVEGEFKDGDKHSVRTEINNDLEKGETQLKQSGIDGSSINVVRTVTDASGNILRKDTFTSVYDAQDEIIEIGPDTDIDLSDYTDDEDEDAESADDEDVESDEDVEEEDY